MMHYFLTWGMILICRFLLLLNSYIEFFFSKKKKLYRIVSLLWFSFFITSCLANWSHTLFFVSNTKRAMPIWLSVLYYFIYARSNNKSYQLCVHHDLSLKIKVFSNAKRAIPIWLSYFSYVQILKSY